MSTRTLSKPEIVILDEPRSDSEVLLKLIGNEVDPGTHSAFPGMHKFSNVTLKRGTFESADDGSAPPVRATPEWTDFNTSDPGINMDVAVDDWLM